MSSQPSAIDATQRRAICQDVAESVLLFFRAFDNSQYDALAAMFTFDGTWDRGGLVLRGREAIIAEMSKRPKTAETRHVVTNLIVTPESFDSAQVEFYTTAFRHDDGLPHTAPRAIRAPFLMLQGGGQLILESGQWLFRHHFAQRLFEFSA